MIKEIYIREPADPNFKINVLDHSDPIESIITKIKMLFGTRPGQVLGDLNFGLGIEDLIFETRVNTIQLEEDIKTQIGQYVTESSNYKIVPSVSFGKAEGYDYCIINVFINETKAFGVLIK
jgi:hypothetical protein